MKTYTEIITYNKNVKDINKANILMAKLSADGFENIRLIEVHQVLTVKYDVKVIKKDWFATNMYR